jgi:hypothetical protein
LGVVFHEEVQDLPLAVGQHVVSAGPGVVPEKAHSTLRAMNALIRERPESAR